MRKIRVLYKEPGKPARGVIAENTPDALRALVGGYLERVRTKNGIAIAYNEDAWALKLPDNCELAGVQFMGPIFIAGYRGERFTDLPEEMVEKLRARYPKLWEEERDGDG